MIWIDVSPLLGYAALSNRLSGIQRLESELYSALVSLTEVRFIALRPEGAREIPWQELQALTRHLRGEGVREEQRPSFLRRVARKLPSPLKQRIASLMRRAQFLAGPPISGGDVVLILGAPWVRSDFHIPFDEYRRRGIKVAVLYYDLIPIYRPEWCGTTSLAAHKRWLDESLRNSDFIFTISRSTASDAKRYAQGQKLKLRSEPIPIPLGTGFSPGSSGISRELPKPNTYALAVSTIEIRKNHELLFRVWRRLLEELPESQVPTLVFAGRLGWLVNDLMEQIKATDFLNGKLVHLDDPTDADLKALYEGCLFTLFPSFYEGWGLPVTESLAFGKPCIASNRSSIPEAGGKLARYIDPDNFTDAYRVIKDTILDRHGLARWSAEIHETFRPFSWRDSAAAILAALDETNRQVHLTRRSTAIG